MKKILCFLFVLSGVDALAQGFYNKGSIISLAPQTILSLPDSLVNTGTLINNGNLTISGAWINTGTYEAGTGQIDFDSDLLQTINHNDQSMGKLTVSGGGEKEFLANITVQSELKLENGVLVSRNGAKIIMDGAVTITGGSDQSHIEGPVERKGQGDWLFPIGNGTVYLPVEIKGVSDAAADGTISLTELTSGQTLSGVTEIAQFSSQRYWQLAVSGGSLAGSMISLPLVGETGLTNNTDLVVVAGSANAMTEYASLGKSQFSGSLALGTVISDLAPTVAYYSVAALSGDKSITIYNGVSANSDGKNDFLRITNIELYPNNRIVIFNRWGDKVFEMEGYDNGQRNFRGESNGIKLPSGTYFYTIDLGDGSKKSTGFLDLR